MQNSPELFNDVDLCQDILRIYSEKEDFETFYSFVDKCRIELALEVKKQAEKSTHTVIQISKHKLTCQNPLMRSRFIIKCQVALKGFLLPDRGREKKRMPNRKHPVPFNTRFGKDDIP